MLRSGSGRRVVSRATTRPESAWEPPAKRFPHRQHQFFQGPIFHYSPTPRRRSVLHGLRRPRLTAAVKIDDAVVMCGLEDRSGNIHMAPNVTTIYGHYMLNARNPAIANIGPRPGIVARSNFPARDTRAVNSVAER